jgi:hypothetical protein
MDLMGASDHDHSIRVSHVELLELCQLADFSWQRRELVVGELKARDTGQIMIHLPLVPHVEFLQIGQQTELGRKRCELVAVDLEQTITIQSLPATTIAHRAARALPGAQ